MSFLRHTMIDSACMVPLLMCLLLDPGLTLAQVPEHIDAGAFSSASPCECLPDGWQLLTFNGIERHTRYSLVEEAGTIVVKAVSDQSASGLVRAITLDPAEYPLIQWRWKVANVLQKGDVTTKAGDDYPARIYITFASPPGRAGYLQRLQQAAARLVQGRDVPYRAITYIWGSNSPVGTMVPNPYTDRVAMFVVQTGDGRSQQWVTQTRNVYDDYIKAFGEAPAAISGIAIMTDTDNTRESAVAWYGDIIFRHAPPGAD